MAQGWIDKPNIIGSSNPTAAELKNLLSEGFRTIISLLDEKLQPPNYDVSEIEKLGFKRYSIPIKDGAAPIIPKLKTLLKTIQQSNPTAVQTPEQERSLYKLSAMNVMDSLFVRLRVCSRN
jgi:hypothetical protein